MLREGAGPRHLDFALDGKHAYVVNELDNTITTLRRVPVCVKDRRSSGSATSPCVWEDVGSVKSESSARMSVGSHSANYKFLNAQKVEEAGVS
jgi:hypothetical protein